MLRRKTASTRFDYSRVLTNHSQIQQITLFLNRFHLAFDADVLHGVRLAVAVVEEQLLTGLYRAVGEDADAMVPIHLHHLQGDNKEDI